MQGGEKMSEKYELIKGLGIQVFNDYVMRPNGNHYDQSNVRASDLEALLATGYATKGIGNQERGCWLIPLPIPKLEPVNLKEVIEKLEDVIALNKTKDGEFWKDTESLIERLKTAGVAK
jgi:hypothetical protein